MIIYTQLGSIIHEGFFSNAWVGPKLLTLHDVLHLLHYSLKTDPAC